MWLFTKIGFFSIVQHHDNPNTYLVRARAGKDLENLKRQLPFLKDRKIHSGDITKDYEYRIFVSTNEFYQIMEKLTQLVDYTNFKKATEKSGQKDKGSVLSQVWQLMFNYQEDLLRKKDELCLNDVNTKSDTRTTGYYKQKSKHCFSKATRP